MLEDCWLETEKNMYLTILYLPFPIRHHFARSSYSRYTNPKYCFSAWISRSQKTKKNRHVRRIQILCSSEWTKSPRKYPEAIDSFLFLILSCCIIHCFLNIQHMIQHYASILFGCLSWFKILHPLLLKLVGELDYQYAQASTTSY